MNDDLTPRNEPALPARVRPLAAAGPSRPNIPGRPPRQNTDDTGITPAYVLFVLQRWWKVVVPVGLVLAGVVAAVVIYLYVPKYMASALIIIESTEPYIAFEDAGGEHNSARYVQTQIEMLRSSIVLEGVVSRPEIATIADLKEKLDPLGYLKDHLSIKQVGKSELYNVGYESPFPSDARTVANAVVAEYLTIQSREDFERSRRVIDILEEERNRRSLDVEGLRSRLMELAKGMSGADPFGNDPTTDAMKAINPLAGLQQQMVEIDVNRELLKAEIQSFGEAAVLMPDPAQSSGLLDLEIGSRPEVQQAELEIAEIRSQMGSIQSTARHWSNNPTYRRLKEDLDTREEGLAELKSNLREVLLAERRSERKLRHQQSIQSLQQQLARLDARKELLSEKVNMHQGELKDELNNDGVKSVQFEFTESELAREEKIFELIAVRKLAMQTELRAPARVRLRKEARLPTAPVKPVPYLILFGSCLAALAAPLGLAIVKERAMRRITDTEQLSRESKLRVLGEVAQIPVRPMNSEDHALARRARSEVMVFTESIDSLRTSLDLTDYLGSHNVLAITSAESSEGKTSVAISLAESIGNATSEPTLILDCDLRKKETPAHFGEDYHPGLAEVLTNECSLTDAIHQINDSSTYYLPAGRAAVNPHRFIKEDQMRQLLDDLRSRFSAIVIDTPPILAASESLVLAKAADAVVFCSLRGVSRSRQVRVATERLEHVGANVLGAVMSGTPMKRYTYLYGAY